MLQRSEEGSQLRRCANTSEGSSRNLDSHKGDARQDHVSDQRRSVVFAERLMIDTVIQEGRCVLAQKKARRENVCARIRVSADSNLLLDVHNSVAMIGLDIREHRWVARIIESDGSSVARRKRPNA